MDVMQDGGLSGSGPSDPRADAIVNDGSSALPIATTPLFPASSLQSGQVSQDPHQQETANGEDRERASGQDQFSPGLLKDGHPLEVVREMEGTDGLRLQGMEEASGWFHQDGASHANKPSSAEINVAVAAGVDDGAAGVDSGGVRVDGGTAEGGVHPGGGDGGGVDGQPLLSGSGGGGGGGGERNVAAVGEVGAVGEAGEMKKEEEEEADSDSSDWDEEAVPMDEANEEGEEDPVGASSYPRTKNEIVELPATERVVVPPTSEIKELGTVHSVVDHLLVVKAHPGRAALDIDSVLCLEDRTPLGKVFEVFGPVPSPYYSTVLTEENIRSVAVGAPVFNVVQMSSFVVPAALYSKGSDASAENDEEPRAEDLDYSDDEKEAAARRMRKRGTRRGAPRRGPRTHGRDVAQPPADRPPSDRPPSDQYAPTYTPLQRPAFLLDQLAPPSSSSSAPATHPHPQPHHLNQQHHMPFPIHTPTHMHMHMHGQAGPGAGYSLRPPVGGPGQLFYATATTPPPQLAPFCPMPMADAAFTPCLPPPGVHISTNAQWPSPQPFGPMQHQQHQQSRPS